MGSTLNDITTFTNNVPSGNTISRADVELTVRKSANSRPTIVKSLVADSVGDGIYYLPNTMSELKLEVSSEGYISRRYFTENTPPIDGGSNPLTALSNGNPVHGRAFVPIYSTKRILGLHPITTRVPQANAYASLPRRPLDITSTAIRVFINTNTFRIPTGYGLNTNYGVSLMRGSILGIQRSIDGGRSFSDITANEVTVGTNIAYRDEDFQPENLPLLAYRIKYSVDGGIDVVYSSTVKLGDVGAVRESRLSFLRFRTDSLGTEPDPIGIGIVNQADGEVKAPVDGTSAESYRTSDYGKKWFAYERANSYRVYFSAPRGTATDGSGTIDPDRFGSFSLPVNSREDGSYVVTDFSSYVRPSLNPVLSVPNVIFRPSFEGMNLDNLVGLRYSVSVSGGDTEVYNVTAGSTNAINTILGSGKVAPGVNDSIILTSTEYESIKDDGSLSPSGVNLNVAGTFTGLSTYYAVNTASIQTNLPAFAYTEDLDGTGTDFTARSTAYVLLKVKVNLDLPGIHINAGDLGDFSDVEDYVYLLLRVGG